VTAGEPSQLSVAVAVPVVPGAEEVLDSIVTLAGAITAGAVVSLIVMLCSQLTILSQLSVAVHVRVMTGQLPAVASLWVMAGAPASQVAVAVAVPIAPGAEEVLHSIVTFVGQLIVTAPAAVVITAKAAIATMHDLSLHLKLSAFIGV
jgi:hypothetical protein